MKFEIGDRVTYWPPQLVSDNLHFNGVVVGKNFARYRVKLSLPDGEKIRSCVPWRLAKQGDLLEE